MDSHERYVTDWLAEIGSITELSNVSSEFLKEHDSWVQSGKELQAILDAEPMVEEQWIKELKFDDLVRVPFNKAHSAIQKLPLRKRIKFLAELDYKLSFLYQATTEYNDKGFGKSISPNTFIQIMGKIKHLEILQSWLFGID